MTGKESPPHAWAELFGLLAAELKKAAARTNVTSAPAFLAEHVRRRLAPRPHANLDARSQSETPGTVGVNTPADPDQRLTPEEVSEQARLLAELLDGGLYARSG